jgi:TPR repeat protein
MSTSRISVFLIYRWFAVLPALSFTFVVGAEGPEYGIVSEFNPLPKVHSVKVELENGGARWITVNDSVWSSIRVGDRIKLNQPGNSIEILRESAGSKAAGERSKTSASSSSAPSPEVSADGDLTAKTRIAAEAGDPTAQNGLGWIYQTGLGVSKDYVKAVLWYRKAAEAGNSDGQNNLGAMYHNGWGVSKDDSKAVLWFRKAAEAGNSAGQNHLGLMYNNGWGVSKDYAKAVLWYRKAAEAGNTDGQNQLGNMFFSGVGVRKDYAEAVRWYRKAAEAGHIWGQTNLAAMYSGGHGVPQNSVHSAFWYRKAADAGLAEAQRRLGDHYYLGSGLKEDVSQAFDWWGKAAAQGDEEAKRSLASSGPIKLTGDPSSDLNAAEDRLAGPLRKSAWSLILELANQGYAPAQYKVGTTYYFGNKDLGIRESEAEAAKWFAQAALQGYDEAEYYLGELYENEGNKRMEYSPEEAEVSYLEAMKWYERSRSHGNRNALVGLRSAADMIEIARKMQEVKARSERNRDERAVRIIGAISSAVAQGAAQIAANKRGQVYIPPSAVSLAAEGTGTEIPPASSTGNRTNSGNDQNAAQVLQTRCGSLYNSVTATCANPAQGQRACYEGAARLCDCYLANAPSSSREQHAAEWQKCSRENWQSARSLSR